MSKVNLHEMLVRVLENQCATLLSNIESCEDEKTRHHLGRMRKRTIEILENSTRDSMGGSNAEKSEIDWHKGDIAEVREGWDRAGTRFTVLGPAIFQFQWWVPITDPVEEDPSYYKEASLKKIEGDR